MLHRIGEPGRHRPLGGGLPPVCRQIPARQPQCVSSRKDQNLTSLDHRSRTAARRARNSNSMAMQRSHSRSPAARHPQRAPDLRAQFAGQSRRGTGAAGRPRRLARRSCWARTWRATEIEGFPEVSELEVIRHFTRLSTWNYGVDTGLYPLGSCTMKYNARINEVVARLDGPGDRASLHAAGTGPRLPADSARNRSLPRRKSPAWMPFRFSPPPARREN